MDEIILLDSLKSGECLYTQGIDYYPEYEIFYDFAHNRLEFLFQENLKGVDSIVELEISAWDYDEQTDSFYEVSSLYLSDWDYNMIDSSWFTIPLSEAHSDTLDSWGGRL